MDRLELFADALRETEGLAAREPRDWSVQSAVIQLHYLVELVAEHRIDFEKLKEINIGLLAVREIEPLDSRIAEKLYVVDAEVDKMRTERRYRHS